MQSAAQAHLASCLCFAFLAGQINAVAALQTVKFGNQICQYQQVAVNLR